jgi:SAM-dependent methyltransferase
MEYKIHTNCRVCKSQKLTPYLDLGQMPLSNNLASSMYDKVHNQRYPLQVLFCENCGLSQLSIVVPAEEMFSHYVYRSGIAAGYVRHCRQMAIDLKAKYGLNADSLHVDIAGNDGALLREFKDVIGHHVINVDPAQNLRGICEAAGIFVFTEFWGMVAARRILNMPAFGGSSSKSQDDTGRPHDPRADLITATNVFAHVDDVREFIEAAKLILKPTGVLVLEFPYLIDFIENNEFDTVYFEHLSYFSIYPLTLLCNELGLNVQNVTHQDIHGGTVRVTIGHGPTDETVAEYVKNERQNYGNIERYHQFAEDVSLTISNFANEIRKLKPAKICGFAASAKGNTLLNAARINPGVMDYIVDETPEKIGKWSPGTLLPIVAMIDMIRTPPDYLVILSWNFANEIMAKCRAAGYLGKFIIPIPDFKVIE